MKSENSLRLDQVERTLADTTERYRSLFDYNPNAVFSLDLTGRFVASNSASENMSGYTLAELRELEIGVLIAPDPEGVKQVETRLVTRSV